MQLSSYWRVPGPVARQAESRSVQADMSQSRQCCRRTLFDVISTAYERNSLIVTTNPPFEHWTEAQCPR
ncbi:MAG: DNA-directed RNA polymerase subunit N (RpoN/RPB10) [Planctomycetaceae bacterium]|jgi:DNA-directed RNA polymerase subunit N (RpoN/RPB10)